MSAQSNYMRHVGPWNCLRCSFTVPYNPDWGKMSAALMKHVESEHLSDVAGLVHENKAMSETHMNQCVCLDQPETTICDNPFIFNGTCTHCGHVFECHYVGAKTIPLEISETKLPPLSSPELRPWQALTERENQLTAALERAEAAEQENAILREKLGGFPLPHFHICSVRV